jgi:thiamine kinase-like enzyme
MRSAELASLAARAVPGTGELDIHRLGSGLVNDSYRVRRDGRLYVLRVAAATSRDLGLDRAWESRVLEIAAAAGLAPIIEYSDPLAGILVARWAVGRSWTPQEAQGRDNILRIGLLARRIQTLPVPSPARTMSPAAWINYYRDALARRGAVSKQRLPGLQSRADALLAALMRFPAATPALCHGDLHPMNLIDRDGTLVALDWEYSHVSDPLWELAGWSSNNDLGPELRRELLASYMGRPTAPDDWSRLQVLAALYDYICLLWSELYLNQRPDGANEGISARVDLLAARFVKHPVVE